jgi:transcriptional regulator with XRE-family HTH domain
MEKLRLDMGWTQGFLAKMSGVSRVTVSYMESGESPGSKLSLWAIGNALDVPTIDRLELLEDCEDDDAGPY